MDPHRAAGHRAVSFGSGEANVAIDQDEDATRVDQGLPFSGRPRRVSRGARRCGNGGIEGDVCSPVPTDRSPVLVSEIDRTGAGSTVCLLPGCPSDRCCNGHGVGENSPLLDDPEIVVRWQACGVSARFRRTSGP